MKTILFACADPGRVGPLQRSLQDAGFAVQLVPQGSLLLDKLEHIPVDMVIMYGELPDVSRITLTRMLRGDLRLEHTYILLMEGDQDEKERLLGFEAGADLCLSGIVQPSVLVARVGAMLRRIPRTQKLASL